MKRDEPLTIWQMGDPWADLHPVFETAKRLTVVTENGTVHLFDLVQYRYRRVPRPSGHPLDLDGRWVRLRRVRCATSCGLVFARAAETIATSRPVLIRLGIHPELATTLRGRQEVDERRLADSEDGSHPVAPCGAAYCVRLAH